jgi:vacuolar protein sorting-associated protein 13A/C
VSLDVRAEGEQQVLRITNYVAERSLYKLKRRNTASSVGRSGTTRSESPSTMGDAFEAVTEEIAPSLSIKLDLQGIGISLINRSLVEVVYLSITKLNLEYTSSSVAQSMTLACGSLQVDNQLHDALFPVVLQPTPIPKDTRGEVAALPTVQASFIWLTDQGESARKLAPLFIVDAFQPTVSSSSNTAPCYYKHSPSRLMKTSSSRYTS